jgi:hypothetical protein
VRPAAHDLLIEAASTPFRARDAWGRGLPSPEFMDLPPAGRVELAARQMAARELERALHPLGWSGTVQAVMERLG